ncbi:hypothetical protein V6N12_036389 [Hibiscus sabdariffa]|uniref:Uncharacterized protein n=1 Tax=Hibiscus sabdariffa TaxID=183260 RepID=A0ABR2EQY4_9ROSI
MFNHLAAMLFTSALDSELLGQGEYVPSGGRELEQDVPGGSFWVVDLMVSSYLIPPLAGTRRRGHPYSKRIDGYFTEVGMLIRVFWLKACIHETFRK